MDGCNGCRALWAAVEVAGKGGRQPAELLGSAITEAPALDGTDSDEHPVRTVARELLV